MSKKPEIELEWADGTYLFALRAVQVEELEAISKNPRVPDKVGIGFGAIYQRVFSGEWYDSDLYNIVRLGLIGGGMGAIDAKRMCETYVHNAPRVGGLHNMTKDSPLAVAQAVLIATIVGIDSKAEDADDRKKDQAQSA